MGIGKMGLLGQMFTELVPPRRRSRAMSANLGEGASLQFSAGANRYVWLYKGQDRNSWEGWPTLGGQVCNSRGGGQRQGWPFAREVLNCLKNHTLGPNEIFIIASFSNAWFVLLLFFVILGLAFVPPIFKQQNKSNAIAEWPSNWKEGSAIHVVIRSKKIEIKKRAKKHYKKVKQKIWFSLFSLLELLIWNCPISRCVI